MQTLTLRHTPGGSIIDSLPAARSENFPLASKPSHTFQRTSWAIETFCRHVTRSWTKYHCVPGQSKLLFQLCILQKQHFRFCWWCLVKSLFKEVPRTLQLQHGPRSPHICMAVIRLRPNGCKRKSTETLANLFPAKSVDELLQVGLPYIPHMWVLE